jgi:HAD superfamily hydrolase (TIGR01509 family)
MLRAVIFDFDGLIVDSEAVLYQTWAEEYARFGRDLPLEQWAVCIGVAESELDPLVELENSIGYSLPDRDRLRTEIEQRAIKRLSEGGALPGVEQVLQQAKQLKMRVGLASSSDRPWVLQHLQRLGLLEYFECIRTTTDVGVGKPDPRSYLAVLEYFHLSPHEAIALEDSPNGILAARNAGVFCIVVPNEVTTRLDISAADLRLNSLTELNLAELQKRFNGKHG